MEFWDIQHRTSKASRNMITAVLLMPERLLGATRSFRGGKKFRRIRWTEFSPILTLVEFLTFSMARFSSSPRTDKLPS